MDLIAIGELLIDFTPSKNAEGQFFKQNAGGAPCNMLAMAQTLGTQTAFIGKVGEDQFGHFLKKTLEEKAVGTQGLILSKEAPTTLAFVHWDDAGDRSFSFYRKGSADVMLTREEVDMDFIASARALHFGSLSFTDEPSKSAVLAAVEHAKRQGLMITYDPNYRPPLWDSEAHAISEMKLGLPYADVLKVSDEEALLLTGEAELEVAAKALATFGVKLVCITLGEAGSYFYHPLGSGTVPGFKAQVVDTTGAGDAFFGSLVHQILQSGKSVEALTPGEITGFLTYANAVASLCIEGLGGIPSLPDKERIAERLRDCCADDTGAAVIRK